MPNESSSYKGKRVFVESSYDAPKLRIDDEQIDVNRDPDSGMFGTTRLPYQVFESIEELGKALVDDES